MPCLLDGTRQLIETPTIDQSEVIGFLRSRAAWPEATGDVDVIETHGALIFMCGADALKIKRAVRLAYLDFSTLELRATFITREYEINAPNAPDIYRGVVAITREADGRLVVGGGGEPVDWALSMRRFSQDDVLSNVVDQGRLEKPLAIALADAVAASHARAPRLSSPADTTGATAHSIVSALSTCEDPGVRGVTAELARVLAAAAAASCGVRDARARDGYVRRCHGDLHLANVVLWNGLPVLFDALEFDEQLATIDTLYDLAFLLMDLERHRARLTANVILNRYLWRTGDPRDLDGLVAMPLFLGLRAAVRAMVALDRAGSMPDQRARLTAHAVETLHLAIALATPMPPRLVVIGGLSGTGKTTLAARLAPGLGAAPGAIHLRSDLERKWLAGVGEFDHLPPSAYTPAASMAVFERVYDRARCALVAGHSVVVDGVFALPHERAAVEAIARQAGVRFDGVWLEAAPEILKQRVATRVGDASDATPAVVDMQLAMDTGNVEWPRYMSGGPPDVLHRQLLTTLGL